MSAENNAIVNVNIMSQYYVRNIKEKKYTKSYNRMIELK